MIPAQYEDKGLVVEILTQSFDDNKSVNYVIKQDNQRKKRLARLMAYSFDYCRLFGEVYLSDDKSACALAILPDKKRTSLKSVILDAKLAISSIGVANLKKAMDREAKIRATHPSSPIYYLWFIGVQPSAQHKGIGSHLLQEVIARSESMHRPVFLETSTLQNLPWYKKFGFDIHHELYFDYKLFCLRRER